MSTVMHRSAELWVLMQARRLGFGRNSLRRPSDRIETALLWCALIAALLMIPVGAAVGRSLQTFLDASAARQRASLHEVQGKTLEGSDRGVPAVPGAALPMVRVSYVDLQGVERVGMRSVVIGTKAGAAVPVWLDQSGNIVTTPRSKSDSAALGHRQPRHQPAPDRRRPLANPPDLYEQRAGLRPAVPQSGFHSHRSSGAGGHSR